jgi:hypothetical protein
MPPVKVFVLLVPSGRMPEFTTIPPVWASGLVRVASLRHSW